VSALPEGWTTTNFGSICGLGQYGWTTKAKAEGSIKYLRTTDITKGQINWQSVPYCFEAPPDFKKYEIQSGDILISRAGSVGFSALISNVPFPTVFASYLIRFVPLQRIEPIYIAYFLKSPEYWQQISQASSGIALANVNAKKLAELQVPIAPLNEQKRIADKLDRLLVRVDACRERCDRIPLILKRFHQSVFAAATSGQLTEDWREEKKKDLEDWEEVTVDKLIDDIEAGINVRCEERPPLPHEQGLVKISSVTWGTFNDNESKTLPQNRTAPESTRIEVGDFLISRANTLELVGACVIVEQVTRPVFLSDKVLRVVMADSYKKWLLFCLRSKNGRAQIEKLASGNQLSMRNLTQANLKSIFVRLPSEDERNEISRRVEILFAFADRLEARYNTARILVDRLTPASLDKAFQGELVPQDPNDEPASVLLERIRSELAIVKVNKNKQSQRPTTTPSITQVNMLTLDDIEPSHLSSILKKRDSLTAEDLWAASRLEIDDFYNQLKKEEEQGLLREMKGEEPNEPRLLEAA